MTMKTKREIMREIVETTLIKTATTDLEGRYHNGKGKNAIEMIIVQGHILVYKGKKKTEFNPWEIEEALDCFFEEKRQTEDKSMSKNTKFELKELLSILQCMNKESQKVYPYLKLNKKAQERLDIYYEAVQMIVDTLNYMIANPPSEKENNDDSKTKQEIMQLRAASMINLFITERGVCISSLDNRRSVSVGEAYRDFYCEKNSVKDTDCFVTKNIYEAVKWLHRIDEDKIRVKDQCMDNE